MRNVEKVYKKYYITKWERVNKDLIKNKQCASL